MTPEQLAKAYQQAQNAAYPHGADKYPVPQSVVDRFHEISAQYVRLQRIGYQAFLKEGGKS